MRVAKWFSLSYAEIREKFPNLTQVDPNFRMGVYGFQEHRASLLEYSRELPVYVVEKVNPFRFGRPMAIFLIKK
jgi:hypothetical protein